MIRLLKIKVENCHYIWFYKLQKYIKSLEHTIHTWQQHNRRENKLYGLKLLFWYYWVCWLCKILLILIRIILIDFIPKKFLHDTKVLKAIVIKQDTFRWRFGLCHKDKYNIYENNYNACWTRVTLSNAWTFFRRLHPIFSTKQSANLIMLHNIVQLYCYSGGRCLVQFTHICYPLMCFAIWC